MIWFRVAPAQVPVEPTVVDQRLPLYVCDGLPPAWADLWLTDEVHGGAQLILESVGWGVDLEIGPCDQCPHGKGITSCKVGRIAVDIADQWFDAEHVGETRGDPGLRWATILLPTTRPEAADPFRDDQRSLPPNWRALVFAHERLHAAGMLHVFTPGPGGFGRTTMPDHVLHPSVFDLGPSLDGVPSSPAALEVSP